MYSNLNFSDEYGHVELNNSIMRLTNKVQKILKSAKEDFDNFICHTQKTQIKLKIQTKILKIWHHHRNKRKGWQISRNKNFRK